MNRPCDATGAAERCFPPKVWLIRHAESEGNVGRVTYSPFSIRLTEPGQQQAVDLATTFVSAPDLIVVSPYLRTQQTAAPLIARFPHTSVEEWPVHEFTYLNTRVHAGTTQTQRAVLAQPYWERCDPHLRDGEGAESFADFIHRIDAMEQRWHEHPGRWIVIFTHGYFIQGWRLRRQATRAPVDAALMARFRECRRLDLPANTQVIEVKMTREEVDHSQENDPTCVELHDECRWLHSIVRC